MRKITKAKMLEFLENEDYVPKKVFILSDKIIMRRFSVAEYVYCDYP